MDMRRICPSRKNKKEQEEQQENSKGSHSPTWSRIPKKKKRKKKEDDVTLSVGSTSISISLPVKA